MLKLGVNIDHVATVREARYRGRSEGEPSPLQAALDAEAAGAHGITAHLREDRRHIQDFDIYHLRKAIRTRLNLEMAISEEIAAIALKVKPEIVCIVPERRQEVTTEGGLDAAGNLNALKELNKRFGDAGIQVSLFIAPDLKQVEAAAQIRSEFVEFHTGAFAEHYKVAGERRTEVDRLISAARAGHDHGLRINAGHGLNYINLPALFEVPYLEELNIGHSIVSRAISVGMHQAVKEMLALMESYRSV